ncbi:methyltransferase type 11 [Candidatus Woesearchaeota archaeon]|nr:MAG: methyltransferase type 11 [Candidatus Woesearchaeota archaeon]
MEHKHSGKSSKRFLDTKKILNELNLNHGQIVIDAGCGDGYFSMLMANEIGTSGKIYSVDSHDDSIILLNKNMRDDSILNIIPIISDIKNVPIKKGIADIYYMSNVLHGFDDVEKVVVLKNANDLLKADGKIGIVEFKKEELPIGPSTDIKLSEEDLINLVSNNGFDFLRSVEVGDYSNFFIFKKNN